MRRADVSGRRMEPQRHPPARARTPRSRGGRGDRRGTVGMPRGRVCTLSLPHPLRQGGRWYAPTRAYLWTAAVAGRPGPPQSTGRAATPPNAIQATECRHDAAGGRRGNPPVSMLLLRGGRRGDPPALRSFQGVRLGVRARRWTGRFDEGKRIVEGQLVHVDQPPSGETTRNGCHTFES